MDEALRTEKALLLGLVPILGATMTLPAAVAVLAAAAASALGVQAAAVLCRAVKLEGECCFWGILVSLGFLVSWVLSPLTVMLLPVAPQHVIYVSLAGVSPIVYYAQAEGSRGGETVRIWIIFAVLMLVLGSVRELAGMGSLFGYPLDGSMPIAASFLALPFGAFLLPALIILCARLAARRRNGKGGGQS